MIFMSTVTQIATELAAVSTMPRIAPPEGIAAHKSAPSAPIDTDAAWQQLLARDAQAKFVYGVTTTSVFCRPGCASRRPHRDNVRFFATPVEAQAAGFRPCRRCRPADGTIASSGLLGTACGSPLDQIRGHIEANFDRRVGLEELGRVANLSPFSVQRLFKREMGVSPLQYQRALRARRLRGALKQGDNVTSAVYDAGFGSSSRAYEANQLGMTPSRFAQGGRGERIAFASAASPFGWMVVGATERGLCWLSLAGTKAEAEKSLRAEFPEATLRRDPSLSQLVDAALASVREGDDLAQRAAATQVQRFDLRGTVFQLRVWQALRQIPRGKTLTYGQLARKIGRPTAIRAVARACALNRVAILVPCHRVIGADGSETGYRWGVERKKKLLQAEKA